jgi:hypothetical protein
MINVIATENGVRMRPGSEELVDLGTAIKVDGIYDWATQNIVVAVSNGSVFTISDGAAAFFSYILLETGDKIVLEDGSGTLLLESTATSTDVTNDTLNDGMRIKFAEYSDDILYLADGSRVFELHPAQDEVTHAATDYKAIRNSVAIEPGVTSGWATYWSTSGATGGAAWDAATRYGSGTADVLENASWPVSGVGFIEIIDKYLFVMQSGTQNIYQSVVEEPWNNEGGVFSAEQLPDDVNAMSQYGGDLVVTGPKSIQFFNNDGDSSTFVPTNYGAISGTGVLAPYSFREIDGLWIFLDNNRRLVAMQGREPSPISVALNTFIQSIPFMDDAISDEVVLDGITYYILRFPSSEKTFAINVADGSWTEWNYNDGGTFRIWAANCITYVPRWDLVVAGDRADGTLKKIASIYPNDDGTEITDTIRSPRMQTSTRTIVAQLLIGLTKTADVINPGTATMSVRWRDDGKDWGTPRTITLDSNQTTDYVKREYRLGSYRNNRQYEFTVPWPYAIQRVEQL